MTPSDAFERENLARHAAWLRSLARALVGEAHADDVAQDAWVAALRRAPAGVALRPWLARVARNFAFQRHRSGARRRAYESHGREPAGAPDPADVAERLDAERALLDAFENLREPYKSALFLRFWHDLAPREIAQRLRVPAGTVRWRLSEGLAELRRVLDARAGRRGAWGAVVLPLLRTEKELAAGALAATTVVSGALVMGQAVKIGAVAVAAALVATGVFVLQRPRSRTVAAPPAPASDVVALDARAVPLAVDAPPIEREREERHAVAGTAAAPEESVLPKDEAFVVTARFVDEDGRALPDATLQALHGDRPSAASGTDGQVRLSLDAEESFDGYLITLVARREGHATRWLETVIRRGETVALGATVLGPGGRASGRVVDDQERAVSGARVACVSPEGPHWAVDRRIFGLPDMRGITTTSTDDEGHFVLTGLPSGPSRFVAVLEDRAMVDPTFFEIRPGEELTHVFLALTPATRNNVTIGGRVLDPSGAPLQGAVVLGTGTEPARVSTDAEGRFALSVERDAAFSLTATDADARFVPARADGNASVDRMLDLGLGEPRYVPLRVVDAQGAAVERYGFYFKDHAGHRFWEAWGKRQGGDLLSIHPEGVTQVYFARDPLYLGVLAPGYAEETVGPFAAGDAPERIEISLQRAATIEGRVLVGDRPLAGARVLLCFAHAEDDRTEKNGFRVRYDAGQAVETVETGEDGSFVLTPRTPAAYVVRAEAQDLAPADTEPIDFLDATPPPITLSLGVGGAIEGRVVRPDGQDPAGTIVGISRGDGTGRTLRVDSTGEYRFERLSPGPWIVALRDTEVSSHSSSRLTIAGGAADPDVPYDWSCTVEHGETTRFDVVAGALRLQGALTIDGRPALGWSACLTPGEVGRMSDDERTLDSRGRFELEASTTGPRVLELESPWRSDRHRFGVLRAELTLAPGVTRWELALETGTVVVEGGGVWDEARGGLAWVWEDPEGAWGFGAVAPSEDGVARITVPAGRIRLVRPRDVPQRDVRRWETRAAVTVSAGGEVRVSFL